jgi:predicted nucleic acid-binding protein
MEPLLLVDSNIFITLIKTRRDPGRELLERFDLEDLVTCGMVRLEVLRGIATEKARRALEGFFDVMQNVQTDNHLWEAACKLGWQVTRSGLNLPAQDIIIAACAIRADAAVLTFDKHFDHIPGVRVVHSLEDI